VKERHHYEDLDVDGRIILKWLLDNRVGVWTGFMWLRVWKFPEDVRKFFSDRAAVGFSRRTRLMDLV
jgi:hypothetical protein